MKVHFDKTIIKQRLKFSTNGSPKEPSKHGKLTGATVPGRGTKYSAFKAMSGVDLRFAVIYLHMEMIDS